MTEREKLISDLDSADFFLRNRVNAKPAPLNEYDKEALLDIAEIAYKAARMLEKAIVTPCKVGDMVYVIEPCNCYNNYSEFDKCHHRRTKATKWIEMVRVPTKHYTRCVKLFERPFKVEYFNKVGKTVFLTKEEAEQALNLHRIADE